MFISATPTQEKFQPIWVYGMKNSFCPAFSSLVPNLPHPGRCVYPFSMHWHIIYVHIYVFVSLCGYRNVDILCNFSAHHSAWSRGDVCSCSQWPHQETFLISLANCIIIGDVMSSMVTIVNKTVLYIWKLLREWILKILITRKKK